MNFLFAVSFTVLAAAAPCKLPPVRTAATESALTAISRAEEVGRSIVPEQIGLDDHSIKLIQHDMESVNDWLPLARTLTENLRKKPSLARYWLFYSGVSYARNSLEKTSRTLSVVQHASWTKHSDSAMTLMAEWQGRLDAVVGDLDKAIHLANIEGSNVMANADLCGTRH